jgi:hypothetical protein
LVLKKRIKCPSLGLTGIKAESRDAGCNPVYGLIRLQQFIFDSAAQRLLNVSVWNGLFEGRAMQHLRAVLVTCVATISITLIVAPPAIAGYNLFVFVQQADSPGNDYSRIDHFSFDECEHSCEADTACNAFTYNQIKGVCFLKSAAAQWTMITLGAITGIKLSPLLPSELSLPSEGE